MQQQSDARLAIDTTKRPAQTGHRSIKHKHMQANLGRSRLCYLRLDYVTASKCTAMHVTHASLMYMVIVTSGWPWSIVSLLVSSDPKSQHTYADSLVPKSLSSVTPYSIW
jgi:hypothetical protein